MINNSEQLVVVLSRSYSTGLCVVRSLGAAGYTIDVVASATNEGDSDYLTKSKYVRDSIEVLTKKVKENADQELVNALLSYKDKNEKKPVLLSTDDYTSSVMDLNRDVLEEIFIMPGITGGGAGSLKYYMDKSVQGEIARRLGIFTPEEWVVSLKEDEIVIPDEMIYPCYVKPLESSLGYKTEMAKCENKEELMDHLIWMQGKFRNRSVLVQEFLDIDEEIDMEGICLDQEIILPGIVWKRVVAQRDKGVPLEGKTFPKEELGVFQEKIIKFLQEFHYIGMFDLGFNIVGKDIYFNELNVRSGGTNFVYFGSGVNLPDLYVRMATGQAYDKEETEIKEFGKSYIYEKVAWNDYLHDYITKEELEKWTAEAEIKFIVRDDDPVPGEIFMAEMEKAERRKLRMDNCVVETVAATGWDAEVAKNHIKETRKRTGMTLKDYVKLEFWNVPADQQEEEYRRILDRRERIKQQREEQISAVAAGAGCDKDTAAKYLKDAKDRIGIPYKDYIKLEFWNIPVAEQEEKYKKELERRERRKKNKEECILHAMETAKWERDFAEKQIIDARKRLGISFKDYKKYNFCLIPEKDQQEQYENVLAKKEQKKALKEQKEEDK